VALFNAAPGEWDASDMPDDAVLWDSPNTDGLPHPGGEDDLVVDVDAGRSVERYLDGETFLWRDNASPSPNDCSPLLGD
jgi:hypothetical protein